MSLSISNLAALDWEAYRDKPFNVWAELLAELLALGKGAATLTMAERDLLSKTLRDFADHSNSPSDLDKIIDLDKAARNAAIALNNVDIAALIEGLKQSTADYQQVIAGIKKEAALLAEKSRTLRLEKVTEAISALTGAIDSIKQLGAACDSKDDKAIIDSLASAVSYIQKLRKTLETAS